MTKDHKMEEDRMIEGFIGNGKYYIILVAIVFCLSSEIFGQLSSPQKTYQIGVLYWSMSIPGQVAMRQGLEQEAKLINSMALKSGKPNVELIRRVAGDGEEGIRNQISQMNGLIDLKVDIIIVQPTDNAALVAPLLRANKEKIPVVAYDQYISDGSLTAYRTSDNYEAGYLDGEYIASKFPLDRVVKLVLVEYPHVSSTVERLNGFLDALTEAKCKYQILKSYSAVEPVSGEKAAMGILEDFPDKGSIDVIFTVNDGGGLTIVKRLLLAGRTEIMIATIDGDPQSVDNIKNHKLTVIDAAQFCGPLGAEALRTAYSILNGENPPYHALVPVFPITCETIDSYPGWMGPVPKSFQKPWVSSRPLWLGNLKIIRE